MPASAAPWQRHLGSTLHERICVLLSSDRPRELCADLLHTLQVSLMLSLQQLQLSHLPRRGGSALRAAAAALLLLLLLRCVQLYAAALWLGCLRPLMDRLPLRRLLALACLEVWQWLLAAQGSVRLRGHVRVGLGGVRLGNPLGKLRTQAAR